MVLKKILEIVHYLMARNVEPVPVERNDEEGNIDEIWRAIEEVDPDGAREVHPPHLAQPAVGPRLNRLYLIITEQPAAVRFRYECEGRSAGTIPGVNCRDMGNRTYITIWMHGYVGRVIVLVSLVTKNEPYRAHPHKLVGKGCERGVCVVDINMTEEGHEHQFKRLGIQYVKRNDIVKSLADRARLRVDPFRQHFTHGEQRDSIVLSAVRLCFQVFTLGEGGENHSLMEPVVSDVIFDKKTISVLHILKSSACSGPAMGGTQVIVLCDKVNAEDIEVVFYSEGWEAMATISLVHRQVAIVFETPAYLHPDTMEHVNVQFRLRRPSDNARSNSLPFEYIPEYSGVRMKKRKVINRHLRNYVLSNWTPPTHRESSPSLRQQELSNLHIDPGPSHIDQAMPGPSHVNQAMPGRSPVVQAMPGPSHVDHAMPGPSHVDQAMPGPSHVDQAMPGPSHVDLAVPGPSQVDQIIPESNLYDQAVPGPSHDDPAPRY